MDQKPNNSKEKDNLKESDEHLDASNGKEMKNIEEKMQKLEIEITEDAKMEGQMESEKFNEAKKEEGFFVPNWLIESLESITRIEMANSGLSTSSSIFHRLCEPKLHGDVKPHMVGPMILDGERDVTGKLQAIVRRYPHGQSLPIPSTPPPDYIIGFKRINILFLDDRVLEFIKCISPKMDGIKFAFEMADQWIMKDERIQAIQCLLNALDGRIVNFEFGRHSSFHLFNLHFPHFIDQCQCILIHDSFRLYQNSDFDILFEWLTNRRQMDAGKQKVLMLTDRHEFDYFFGRIKEEFSNATDSLNFLINFHYHNFFHYGIVHEVDLENENTGEVMVSFQSRGIEHKTTIIRCPKGQEEQWKEEGEQKMEMFDYFSDDVTHIELDIKHFGTFTDLAKNAQQE